MKPLVQEFFVISAERDHFTEHSNINRTEELKQLLEHREHVYKQAQGCYKGQTEASFVVITDDSAAIMYLADFFGQESVLHRNKTGECALLFSGGDRQPLYLGQWNEVSCIEACGSENYTKVDGRYFVTKKFTKGASL